MSRMQLLSKTNKIRFIQESKIFEGETKFLAVHFCVFSALFTKNELI